jgi:hypothetical protein
MVNFTNVITIFKDFCTFMTYRLFNIILSKDRQSGNMLDLSSSHQGTFTIKLFTVRTVVS